MDDDIAHHKVSNFSLGTAGFTVVGKLQTLTN
jgi:hypothetical protein